MSEVRDSTAPPTHPPPGLAELLWRLVQGKATGLIEIQHGAGKANIAVRGGAIAHVSDDRRGKGLAHALVATGQLDGAGLALLADELVREGAANETRLGTLAIELGLMPVEALEGVVHHLHRERLLALLGLRRLRARFTATEIFHELPRFPVSVADVIVSALRLHDEPVLLEERLKTRLHRTPQLDVDQIARVGVRLSAADRALIKSWSCGSLSAALDAWPDRVAGVALVHGLLLLGLLRLTSPSAEFAAVSSLGGHSAVTAHAALTAAVERNPAAETAFLDGVTTLASGDAMRAAACFAMAARLSPADPDFPCYELWALGRFAITQGAAPSTVASETRARILSRTKGHAPRPRTLLLLSVTGVPLETAIVVQALASDAALREALGRLGQRAPERLPRSSLTTPRFDDRPTLNAAAAAVPSAPVPARVAAPQANRSLPSSSVTPAAQAVVRGAPRPTSHSMAARAQSAAPRSRRPTTER